MEDGLQPTPYIHGLSDDILREIFSYVTSDNTQTTPFTPIQYILGTVCHRWRELILCSPLLWTDIYLPLKEPYRDSTLFERSSPALINVTYSEESWSFEKEYNAFRSSLTRLRRLKIIFGEENGFPLLFALPPREALNFRQLEITYIGTTRYLYHDRPLTMKANFLDHINSLRRLRLTAVQFEPHPILPNLTTLEMGQIHPGLQTLQTLFDNSPALETLVIGQFLTAWGFLHSEPSEVEAPSLRSLAINLNDHKSTSGCRCELPYLIARNLEYLEISYLGWSFTEHLSSILSHFRHFTRLRKLRIRNPVFLKEDTAFLATLQESTHLELVGFPSCMHPDVGLSILNLSSVQSIAIDLSKSSLSVLKGLKEGIMSLSSSHTTPHCPITVCHGPDDPEPAFWQPFIGENFSLRSESLSPGLLDEYLDAYNSVSVPYLGPLFDGSLEGFD